MLKNALQFGKLYKCRVKFQNVVFKTNYYNNIK